MTHTPGPWRVGPPHKDGTFAIHADKASIVHCTPFGSSNGHAQANAHLIAAAPELLDCLWAIRSTVHFHAMSKPLQEQIMAAIAKAEGK